MGVCLTQSEKSCTIEGCSASVICLPTLSEAAAGVDSCKEQYKNSVSQKESLWNEKGALAQKSCESSPMASASAGHATIPRAALASLVMAIAAGVANNEQDDQPTIFPKTNKRTKSSRQQRGPQLHHVSNQTHVQKPRLPRQRRR